MTEARERWLLVAITVVAAAVRLHGLGTQSIWLDEWYSVSDAALSARDIYWLPDGEPPLHKLLLHLLFVCGFDSDVAARLPSAIAGTLAVPLAWWVARRLADPVVGLVTATLLALNPFAVWYAHEARVYALLLLCALGATAAWLAGPERGSNRVGYAIWMSLGIACHYFFAFVGMAHVVAALLDGRRVPPRRRAWIATFAVAAAAMAVWLPPLVYDFAEQAATDDGVRFTWWSLPYTAFVFAGGFSLGPPLRVLHEAVARGEAAALAVEAHAAVVTVTLIVSALLGLLALSSAPLRRRPLLASMVVVTVVAPMLVGMFATGYRPRYAIAALPFWLCWQACALRGRSSRVAAALLAGLAMLETVGLVQLEHPEYAREDVRAAAAQLRADAPIGPVLLIGEPATAFRRYADPRWQVFDLNARGGDADRTLAEARAAVAGARQVVIVASRPWTIDANGSLRGSFAHGGRALAKTTYPGVTVERYAFERAGP